MASYSKIELLSCIKSYNKINNDKIKNADKMKKDELVNICQRYHLLSDDKPVDDQCINLHNISKRDLKKDIEIHCMLHDTHLSPEVMHMKKEDLVEYMYANNIKHYSKDDIESMKAKYAKNEKLKMIIVQSMIKYDNIDVEKLDNEHLEDYIIENGLDVNIQNLQAYSLLLKTLYTAYHRFCEQTGTINETDKIKSFPKILMKLSAIL